MPTEKTAPKTTQPRAKSLRAKETAKTTDEAINKTLDAFPDKIDIRDWTYQPSLRPLPDQLINSGVNGRNIPRKRERAARAIRLTRP